MPRSKQWKIACAGSGSVTISGCLAQSSVSLCLQQVPRRRFTCRQRTSRFMGVGSSNRNNQWQARILVHGKVGSA